MSNDQDKPRVNSVTKPMHTTYQQRVQNWESKYDSRHSCISADELKKRMTERGGRGHWLAALDLVLSTPENQSFLAEALTSSLYEDPVHFFKTIVSPLLPKQSVIDETSTREIKVVTGVPRPELGPEGEGENG